jgi:hypothetical protein
MTVRFLLLRLSLLLSLLAIIPHLSFGMGVSEDVRHKKDSGTIVEQADNSYRHFAEERQRRPFQSAIGSRGTQRISNSRPAKYHPTHSGKQNRATSSNPKPYSFRFIFLSFRLILSNLNVLFVSPRLYYVITLRHILC